MKKIAVLFTAMMFALVSFGQYINKAEETSFTFIPPDGAETKVTSALFPTAKSTSFAYTTNDSLLLPINNFYNFLDVAALGGTFHLLLTNGSKLTPGAQLIMKFACDGTNRKVVFAAGFQRDSVTVTANTNKKVLAVYNGSAFQVIQ